MTATTARSSSRFPHYALMLVPLMAVGGLVTYKASGALQVIAKVRGGDTVHPKAEWIATAGLPAAALPLVGALNYLSWVVVALAFGVVIGGTVKALVPSRFIQRVVAARGARGYALAALAGTPLMLCSCCVAPVFEGVYERARRLGPSLGLMLAAPALNPAVLALTFLLFPARLAWARLVVTLAMVLLGSAALGHLFPDAGAAEACTADDEQAGPRDIARGLASSLREVALRSLPAIVLGVVLSAALAGAVPLGSLAAAGGPATATLLVAAVAVPLALPTFGEIPLSLALLGAGAPEGAALALLIAGPAINLPSLLTLRKIVSLRVAVAVGITVYASAALGGLVVGR